MLAAGAFVRQGVIDEAAASGLGLLGTILGDGVGYAIGRFGQGSVRRRIGGSTAWQGAQSMFDRRGGLAILLTRFMRTPLAVPVNLIAGGSGYGLRRFLAYDIAGEMMWVVLYGGIGYVVGSQWELIGQFVSDFSGLLVGLFILGVGVYCWLRLRRDQSHGLQ